MSVNLCASFSLSDTETHCEVMQEIVDLILEVSFAQGLKIRSEL